jgi:hypothetical protein
LNWYNSGRMQSVAIYLTEIVAFLVNLNQSIFITNE